MIAATALASGLPVYTCNPNDFAGIDGLEVVPVLLPDGSATRETAATCSGFGAMMGREAGSVAGWWDESGVQTRRSTGRGASDADAHVRSAGIGAAFGGAVASGARHRSGASWSFDGLIPAPKKPRRLPVVLSPDEVVRALDCVASPRHRAVLTTCDAAGLRISEAVRLRPLDVDSQRMVIRIEQGKGQRDRDVRLSPTLLEV
jgi:integrase